MEKDKNVVEEKVKIEIKINSKNKNEHKKNPVIFI